MRQWKTTLLSDYKLDNRSREDVLNQMKELAVSYTPEWLFDTDKPDIGSCIALLFADDREQLLAGHCILLRNSPQFPKPGIVVFKSAVQHLLICHSQPSFLALSSFML